MKTYFSQCIYWAACILVGTSLSFGRVSARDCEISELTGSELANQPDLSSRAITFDHSFLLNMTSYALPKLGLKYGANRLQIELCILDLQVEGSSGFAEFSQKQLAVLWKRWQKSGYQEVSPFEAMEEGDLHFSMQAGYRDEAIQSYLIQDLIRDQYTGAAGDFFKKLQAHYYHLQIYDIGAELIADDLILICPRNSTKVYWIYLRYMHA